jgi:Translation elongation factor P (EF-P)/translation initiation factor 5A (eIF-5A)
LYEDENEYYFMHGKTFEQTNIKKILWRERKFLKENLEVIISFYNERPILIELPNQINCKIDSTDVALKGQTVSSSYKPAILDNGIKIQVPPFVESGDEIIVDTRSIEYVKKV